MARDMEFTLKIIAKFLVLQLKKKKDGRESIPKLADYNTAEC